MTPVLLAALSFLVLAGRLSSVRGDVTAVARDAARAASRAASYDQAAVDAQATAAANLGHHDVTCRDLTVALGGPATFVPGGTVSVTVTCTVGLADVALPGLPGSRTIDSTAVEVIDLYQGMPSR